MVFLLEKIIELLATKDGLTVSEIQYILKSAFGIIVPQKRIIHAIEKNGDKLDVMRICDKTTVMLTPAYRELIAKSKNYGNMDLK